jgi:5-keto 4-deoxyuronate isomerase
MFEARHMHERQQRSGHIKTIADCHVKRIVVRYIHPHPIKSCQLKAGDPKQVIESFLT